MNVTRLAMLTVPMTFVACGVSEARIDTPLDEPVEAVDEVPELQEDLQPVPVELANPDDPGTITSALADGTPQRVFIDFTGPIIYDCAAGVFCDDAPTRHNVDIGTTFGHKGGYVNFLPYGGTSTDRATIVNFLKAKYGPYNVLFTTTRPTSGGFASIIISPSLVGSTGARGTTRLDCGNNWSRNQISFVYRIGSTSAATIGRYAAHELGHQLGLMHVKLTGSYYDIMEYRSAGTRWTNSYLDATHNPVGYTCQPTPRQDAVATLVANVGRCPQTDGNCSN